MIFVIVHYGSDHRIFRALGIIMVAAPWIVGWIITNSSMIGIEFNVSTALKPMWLIFNKDASIAAVPQVSFVLVF